MKKIKEEILEEIKNHEVGRRHVVACRIVRDYICKDCGKVFGKAEEILESLPIKEDER